MTVLTEYKRETKNSLRSRRDQKLPVVTSLTKMNKVPNKQLAEKKNNITAFYAHYVSQAISSCMNMFPLFLNSSDLTEDLYSYHSVTHESQHFM